MPSLSPSPSAVTTTAKPSPSPPPFAPPIQSSPGPRAAALQQLFADALSHTLKTCSYPSFASCFPTPATYEPDALHALWRDFTARLRDVCQSNFASLLTDRAVVPALNELDALVADAKKRRDRAAAAAAGGYAAEPPVALHTLPPLDLLQAHLHPFLRDAHAELARELERTQRGNEVMLEEIGTQRAEMEGLVGGLEGWFGDLEGGVGVLMGVGCVGAAAEGGLVGEIMGMAGEVEMEGEVG